jgi:hypothetical protein
MSPVRWARPVLLALLLVATLAPAATAVPRTLPPHTLPPVGTDWDYQLGGARPVPAHVGIVERDRHASPAAGRYNICYVNGFQTQADEKKFWRRHWSLVLQRHGHAVVDENWDEWLLDIGTPAKRASLARIEGRWVSGCAAHGFDAVEFDNLDSFQRSHGLLTAADSRAFAGLLVAEAHAAGLAAAQKNRAGWDGTTVGYDFAVAEQCAQYDECGSYVAHYGRHVLAVEYHDQSFAKACGAWSGTIALVRRDVDLTRHGVRRWC